MVPLEDIDFRGLRFLYQGPTGVEKFLLTLIITHYLSLIVTQKITHPLVTSLSPLRRP